MGKPRGTVVNSVLISSDSSSSSDESSGSSTDVSSSQGKSKTSTPKSNILRGKSVQSPNLASHKAGNKISTPSKESAGNVLSGWDQDEIQSLIEQVARAAKGTKSCRSALNAFDWSQISLDNKSERQIQLATTALVNQVRRHRTLSEVVSDLSTLTKRKSFMRRLNPDVPKQPVGPFFRYVKANRDRIKKKYPNISVTQITTKAKEEFDKMSEAQKALYQKEYAVDKEKYNKMMARFMTKHPEFASKKKSNRADLSSDPTPKKPRSPFALFVATRSLENESRKAAVERLKPRWEEMSNEKMLKWIKKAVEDVDRYTSDARAYQEKHEDYVISGQEPNLNAQEREILDRDRGVPVNKPISAQSIFAQDMMAKDPIISLMEGSKRRKAAFDRWKTADSATRKRYQERFEKQEADFLNQVQVYLKTLSDEERINYLTKNHIPPLDKYKKKTSSPSKLASAAKKDKSFYKSP